MIPFKLTVFLVWLVEVRDHCLALGRGLMQSCQVGGMGLREGELLGIRLQNSIEW